MDCEDYVVSPAGQHIYDSKYEMWAAELEKSGYNFDYALDVIHQMKGDFGKAFAYLRKHPTKRASIGDLFNSGSKKKRNSASSASSSNESSRRSSKSNSLRTPSSSKGASGKFASVSTPKKSTASTPKGNNFDDLVAQSAAKKAGSLRKKISARLSRKSSSSEPDVQEEEVSKQGKRKVAEESSPAPVAAAPAENVVEYASDSEEPEFVDLVNASKGRGSVPNIAAKKSEATTSEIVSSRRSSTPNSSLQRMNAQKNISKELEMVLASRLAKQVSAEPAKRNKF